MPTGLKLNLNKKSKHELSILTEEFRKRINFFVIPFVRLKNVLKTHLMFTERFCNNTKCQDAFLMFFFYVVSKRCLRTVMWLTVRTQDNLLTSFVRYGCLTDVLQTSCYWESNKDVFLASFVRYGCLKDYSETSLCLLSVKTQDFFLTS